MPLTPQSIRKTVSIYVNGELVEKQTVLDLSNDWSESQINFFKKMIKQGGSFKINGNSFEIKPAEPLLTSKGEKDQGIIVYPE
jgi:hypothetical protein